MDRGLLGKMEEKIMAKCVWCNQEMNEVDDCSGNQIIEYPDGTKLPASTEHFDELSGRCRDCNIKHGNYHHPACDVERCPRCGGQLITCGCLDEDEEEDE